MARLRRLGVVKGVRELRLPSAAPEGSRRPAADTPRRGPLPLEQLLPGGRVVESDDGGCFVIDRVYATHHRHGGDALADLLGSRPAAGAAYVREPRLEALEFRDFLFLDTETTGLAGAGTLAFICLLYTSDAADE